ncbi:hypothetical protein [Parabacteroides sp. FAFU027]|uniref:hypothetical protein n=1 Tax=Parabacteroides sp. FAFU027 TaxID=2922715 RepID=UPI001FAF0071|nr:hypothetical protein [Parabacteroides sp. FAFU027]
MRITHLRHNQIDKEKWDATIANAANCRIYALSWYLDIVSPGWETLATEEYQYVMPLPVKRKFGFPYLVQPLCCQQLGVFSALSIASEIVTDFIHSIPYFRYDLQLNSSNPLSESIIRTNITIDLSLPFEDLKKKYSKNTIRNINKTTKEKLKISSGVEFNLFRNFILKESRFYTPEIISIIENLYQVAHLKDQTEIWGVFQENTLLTATFFLKYKERYYYLAPVSSEKGKQLSAMFALMNQFLIEKSGKTSILDFEGSSLPEVARFYTGLGGEKEEYYRIRREFPLLDLFRKK